MDFLSQNKALCVAVLRLGDKLGGDHALGKPPTVEVVGSEPQKRVEWGLTQNRTAQPQTLFLCRGGMDVKELYPGSGVGPLAPIHSVELQIHPSLSKMKDDGPQNLNHSAGKKPQGKPHQQLEWSPIQNIAT